MHAAACGTSIFSTITICSVSIVWCMFLTAHAVDGRCQDLLLLLPHSANSCCCRRRDLLPQLPPLLRLSVPRIFINAATVKIICYCLLLPLQFAATADAAAVAVSTKSLHLSPLLPLSIVSATHCCHHCNSLPQLPPLLWYSLEDNLLPKAAWYGAQLGMESTRLGAVAVKLPQIFSFAEANLQAKVLTILSNSTILRLQVGMAITIYSGQPTPSGAAGDGVCTIQCRRRQAPAHLYDCRKKSAGDNAENLGAESQQQRPMQWLHKSDFMRCTSGIAMERAAVISTLGCRVRHIS